MHLACMLQQTVSVLSEGKVSAIVPYTTAATVGEKSGYARERVYRRISLTQPLWNRSSTRIQKEKDKENNIVFPRVLNGKSWQYLQGSFWGNWEGPVLRGRQDWHWAAVDTILRNHYLHYLHYLHPPETDGFEFRFWRSWYYSYYVFVREIVKIAISITRTLHDSHFAPRPFPPPVRHISGGWYSIRWGPREWWRSVPRRSQWRAPCWSLGSTRG